jgi:Leucine-rich repeat (LRR) protein
MATDPCLITITRQLGLDGLDNGTDTDWWLFLPSTVTAQSIDDSVGGATQVTDLSSAYQAGMMGGALEGTWLTWPVFNLDTHEANGSGFLQTGSDPFHGPKAFTVQTSADFFAQNGMSITAPDSLGTIVTVEVNNGIQYGEPPTLDESDATQVTIADDYLRSCINEALNQDATATITVGQLNAVRNHNNSLYLNCYGEPITSLAGIEALSVVTGVDARLSNVTTTDLSPLAALTNMSSLDIGSEDGTAPDLSPIGGLTNLTDLSLDFADYPSLDALAGLSNVSTVTLSSSNGGSPTLPDLTPLTKMASLRSVSISFFSGLTDASSVAALANAPRLRRLELSYTGITDLTPLAGLTGLTYLDLSGSGGYDSALDISPLASLTCLQALSLSGAHGLADVSALSGLPILRSLDISGSDVTDVSSLAGMPWLVVVNIDGAPVADTSAVSGNTNLHIVGTPRS